MRQPAPSEQRQVYLSGVAAVEKLVGSFDTGDWAGKGCGDWTAEETVRHLVGVVGWYEEWLERALNGVSAVPFPQSEFVTRNASALEGLQHLAVASTCVGPRGGSRQRLRTR